MISKAKNIIAKNIAKFFLGFKDIENEIQPKSFLDYIEKQSEVEFQRIIESIEKREQK